MYIIHRGRPRAWSDESLVTMALEWRRRHGRLPRASDWSTAKARNHGGAAQQRLDDPPPGRDRWPPASTVNDAFGNWAAFRDACERGLPSQQARPVWAHVTRWNYYHLHIGVVGDPDIVERARDRWRGHDAKPADERRFVVWVVLNGQALVSDPDGRFSTDAKILEQQLLDALVRGDLWLAFHPTLGPVGGTSPE